MTRPTRSFPDQQSRRARAAVAALFFTNGALFANLLPRYPEIKASLDLSNTSFGIAVAAFPVGAMVAGLTAGALIRRFGSAKVAVGGTILTGLGVLLAGVAPSFAVFALGLFVGGAMDAITDVAQNAHGLRVQRLYGRSILNSFHAVWSIGAVTGGAMAAGAIALHLKLWIHLTISAVVFTVVAIIALRFCLTGPDSAAATEGSSEKVGQTIARAAGRPIAVTMAALVLIAVVATMVEDAGNSWAALYLSNDLGAVASIAALGYIALTGAQFIGRLLGDRMVDRFGARTVARTGGLIVLAGMGSALAFPSLLGTILGFASAGFGVATLVPAAMHEADELPGLRPGTGLTVLSWLMRLGFLISPPLVGLIADNAGLRAGLLTVPAAGIVVILLAGVLRAKRR
ncbi:MFS transporter [Rarobacter faecitabidus]|uniref:Fucose permease n=1 Tax=Rarobacter faecitabidus TaxID=13243 RepID=A0A542ZV57_RARFA|nr:MFS transporter [Rarobacter faecitabidus]TQL64244.1 fucose permease [Rarobacter faecitabidus]